MEPDKKKNNTSMYVKVYEPNEKKPDNGCWTYSSNYELVLPTEKDPKIYIHTDQYFKSGTGLYIMVECLLSLINKDLNKCCFYDTYTLVSGFDSSTNKTIYVKFDNITNTYLLDNNNNTRMNYFNPADDAIAGIYDD